MTRGDMITVQVGMPHQWRDVPKSVSYLAFHSFPEHNQPAAAGAKQGALAPSCYSSCTALPAHRRVAATYEDLLKVPDSRVAEIVGGDLYSSPRPAPRHAAASSGLGGALHGPFDGGRGGPGGWRILDEPELHFRADVIVPDIAGWTRQRLPARPDEAFFSLAPDWICEVLSPSTAALDRTKKLAVYARERVGHAWLVDPIVRTLEILRFENGRWTILSTWSDAAVVRAEPFDALAIDLTLLWEMP